MTYRIRLPRRPGSAPGAPEARLDVVDGVSTYVQRTLRRGGLAAYEPTTMATVLALTSTIRPLVVFDVGANAGLYSAVVSRLAQPEAVIAFEPTPTTAAVARRVMAANQLSVTVEELALSDADGTMPLFLSAASDASNSLAAGFKDSVGTVDVTVERLDTFVARSGLVPTLVKIDTETFEPQVVAGAAATLRDHRPWVIVEVLNRGGRDHGPELEATLADLGYRYHRIADGVLTPADAIEGATQTVEHDWLLAPGPLPPELPDLVAAWYAEIARCTADTNDRLPVVSTFRAAVATAGWRRTFSAVVHRRWAS